jgi:hypothetical protein
MFLALLKFLVSIIIFVLAALGIVDRPPDKEHIHDKPREDGLVTIMPPYTGWDYSGQKPVPRIRLEGAVIAVCVQAGIEYDGGRSHANVGSSYWQWVAPVIEDKPPKEALDQLLTPLGLTYAIEDNRLVLMRMDLDVAPEDRLVTLEPPYYLARASDTPVPTVTVQFAVMAISFQVGYSYDWEGSQRNAGTACHMYVTPSIVAKPWDEAMEEIIASWNLTYIVENDTVVLQLIGGIQDSLSNPVLPWENNPGTRVKRQVSLKPPFGGWNPNRHDADDVISVEHAVNALCRQTGMTFDFERSRSNAGPLCESRISPVIDKEPWDQAMEEILGPLGLSYRIENNSIVLVRG